MFGNQQPEGLRVRSPPFSRQGRPPSSWITTEAEVLCSNIMSYSKRQHYIPRFILRNFSCDGHIWTFSRNKGLLRQNTAKVFRTDHLYSKKTIDTNNRSNKSSDLSIYEQSVKKDPCPYDHEMIGRLESSAAPVVAEIIERVRRGNGPPKEIPERDLITLKKFLYLTARRTPESHDHVFSDVLKNIDKMP